MLDEADEKSEISTKHAKQGRSPAYPSLDLKQAIAKAKAQYDAEGKYPAPMPSAFAAWGFSIKSSGGRAVRASLKYFGLVTVEGDNKTGKVKLTDDALRIILDEREDQTEKKALIRKLALLPSIHRVLAEQYPEGIKSDSTVEHSLIFDHGFNKSAATELVSQFKLTADFAGLFKPDNTVVKSLPVAEDEVQVERDPENDGKGKPHGFLPPSPNQGSPVKLIQSERVVFAEEGLPNQYLKLIASGDVDDVLLEALEDFVKRQRKRLGAAYG
jgi:hypothetical protein